MSILAGIDIGGTKCAVSLGRANGDGVELAAKRRFPTPDGPDAALAAMVTALDELARAHELSPEAIGISCGGPLDSRNHRVLSPPNLPGWDDVDVLTPFQETFPVPLALQNDANACALAEWQWGAGRGCSSMVFLTFGTGMGAGLILNGRLYSGANDLAGEVGHMRLADDGPVGHNKAGSFEGFCSGGGIAQLARTMAEAHLRAGKQTAYCGSLAELPGVTAEAAGKAAEAGDALALELWRTVGRRLGQGLAILVDVLNPERIVIGSIYGRQQAILEPVVQETLAQEALALALSACEVVPAGLGERVGDYAALAVARLALTAQG